MRRDRAPRRRPIRRPRPITSWAESMSPGRAVAALHASASRMPPARHDVLRNDRPLRIQPDHASRQGESATRRGCVVRGRCRAAAHTSPCGITDLALHDLVGQRPPVPEQRSPRARAADGARIVRSPPDAPGPRPRPETGRPRVHGRDCAPASARSGHRPNSRSQERRRTRHAHHDRFVAFSSGVARGARTASRVAEAVRDRAEPERRGDVHGAAGNPVRLTAIPCRGCRCVLHLRRRFACVPGTLSR